MVATWSADLWLQDVTPVDHETLGLARLLWQYRGDQPRLQGTLVAFLTGLQSIEDVSLEVLTGVWPLTAVGVQLDVIGDVVGQLRGTLTDDEYRLAILGRIFVNKGDGQLPQFFELLQILGVAEQIRAYEFYPAAFEVGSSQVTYPDVFGDLVGDLSPAGVACYFTYSDEDDDAIFETADTLGTNQLDVDRGLSNVAGLVGGELAGVTVY